MYDTTHSFAKNNYQSRWQQSMPDIAWGTILLFLTIVTGYALVIPAAIAGYLAYPIATLVCGYLAFASFTVAHDAGHGNLFKLGSPLKPMESWLGWMASIPLLIVPYRFFQKIHDRHHAFTNDPDRDPDYMPETNSWLKVVVNAYLVPYKYHKLALTQLRHDPVLQATFPSTIAFLSITLGGLITLTIMGYGLEVLFLAILPLLIAIFFLALFFDYVPHYPHKLLDRYHNTRIYPGKILNLLLLGQNYHLIHHLHPRLPWYKYQEVYYKTKAELEKQGAPIDQIGKGGEQAFLLDRKAIDIPADSSSIHLLLKVKSKRRLTDDAVAVDFTFPGSGSLKYQAGQYITLSKWLAGAMHTRCYSLCASPSKGLVSIGVKKTRNGLVSGFIHDQLQPGDELIVQGPFGHFVYPPNTQRQVSGLILVAGGSGITPILSILETALEQQAKLPVHLIYACKNKESIMFFSQLEALKSQYSEQLKLSYVLENPPESLRDTGRLSKHLLFNLLGIQGEDIDRQRCQTREIYVCGPEPMKAVVLDSLCEFGFDADRIHVEQFTKPQTQPIGVAKTVQISLADGHHRLQVASNQTVLEVANVEGINIPHACGNGLCGSCKLKVSEGKVMPLGDSVSGITAEETDAGYTLACQCRPLTDLKLAEVRL